MPPADPDRLARTAPGWERATLERLAFAALDEQRISRRWRIFFRLVWLALLGSLVWMALHRGGVAHDVTSP
ncbi:MAG: S49 family peptidase, partial [Burkholderiaceae bacterium]